MEAYYRQSLKQLAGTNADRLMHFQRTGAHTNPPPAKCAPLAEVREEKIADRWKKEKKTPTPKQLAQRQKEHRTHGKRVYDTFQASQLWKRLDEEEPAPPVCPLNPEEGFDDDIIELAMRGRAVNKTAMDKTPSAAYMQWRSLVRLERKHNGPDADLKVLTQEYLEAVRDYRERWWAVQRAVESAYEGDNAEPEEGKATDEEDATE